MLGSPWASPGAAVLTVMTALLWPGSDDECWLLGAPVGWS